MTRTLLLALAVTLAAGTAPAARADVLLTFEGTAPARDLAFSAGDRYFGVMPTGVMQFTSGAGAAEAGFGPAVRAFCVDIFRDVAHDRPMSYAVVPVTSLSTLAGDPEAGRKVAYLTELWGRFAAGTTTDTAGAAFALSVWKLLYDPVAGRGDFAAGFIRFAPDAIADPAVATAAGWLAGLTGDTAAFTDNPLYAGQELVGLAAAGGGQDQLTVRGGTAPVIPAPAGVVLLLIGVAVAARHAR